MTANILVTRFAALAFAGVCKESVVVVEGLQLGSKDLLEKLNAKQYDTRDVFKSIREEIRKAKEAEEESPFDCCGYFPLFYSESCAFYPLFGKESEEEEKDKKNQAKKDLEKVATVLIGLWDLFNKKQWEESDETTAAKMWNEWQNWKSLGEKAQIIPSVQPLYTKDSYINVMGLKKIARDMFVETIGQMVSSVPGDILWNCVALDQSEEDENRLKY